MQCMYCNNSLVNRIIQVLRPCFVVGALIDIFIVFSAYILYSLVFLYIFLYHAIMYIVLMYICGLSTLVYLVHFIVIMLYYIFWIYSADAMGLVA